MVAKQEIKDWVQAIIAVFLFIFLLRSVVFIPVEVDGHSMYPTLEDGDKGLVNRFEPHIFGYNRFDVVVFQATVQSAYVKRIIGLPGDEIQYINDELYINGEVYDEPYLAQLKQALADDELLTSDFSLEQLYGTVTVPQDYYFVLGDNRKASKDSRFHTVGFVSEDQLKGKLAFIVFPIENRQWFN